MQCCVCRISTIGSPQVAWSFVFQPIPTHGSMVEAWFDFDEISKLEDLDDDEAEQLCDDSTPDTRPTLARPDAPPPFSSLEGSTLETEHLVPVDDRANGVLYIVQFTVATTPQELYKELAPGGMSCKTELGLGRTLVYLPNGVCMAMEEDPKRSLCPVRREYVIHQTKCGRTLSEARKVDTWEGAVARPLLRFRTVWELKAAPDGKSTRVRCNLSEFEQCQRQELDLAELVIASKDQEILRLLQKFGGADASPPSDYLVFSAPATAELLKAASEGNAKALPRILAKRADPNFTCEPAGYNGELTPLMAAVRARSSPCARLLLQDFGLARKHACAPGPRDRGCERRRAHLSSSRSSQGQGAPGRRRGPACGRAVRPRSEGVREGLGPRPGLGAWLLGVQTCRAPPR
mmetsp:Transcript_94600/g.294696  ORF Transcript_94600/g.294696 Transcript_94600/m.294696 type:complete len:405 (-) Transcript_94600:152-1366(-)